MSFLTEFFDVFEGAAEIPVCCPFNHFTSSGVPYKESHPSAHINNTEHLFHCKVCQIGYSEPQFIVQLFGCTYLDAKRIQRVFENTEDKDNWEESTQLSGATKTRAMELGISEAVLTELSVKTPPNTEDIIGFPVFMYNHLMDIRSYNPGGSPKIKSRMNSVSGLILPFDIWRTTEPDRITLICAGEKDMAIARSHGFNAITLTGGEGSLCKCPKMFEGRSVAIVYDNDGAGLHGAKALAVQLHQYTNRIRIVTKFHEVCTGQGEDITDYFTKYNKTRNDLIQCIDSTPYFVPSIEDLHPLYKLVNLYTASKAENINRIVQSNIQVVAVSDTTFATPSAVTAEKFKLSDGAGDTMAFKEMRTWELEDSNCENILHLIDNNFKEETIEKNLRYLLKIPEKERYVKIKAVTKQTVFKVYVTDMFETSDTAAQQPMEYTAYCINCKLESGKKYLVTYKITPHPYKGQQLIMIIIDAVQANDSVSNFMVDTDAKQNLKAIQDLPGNVPEKINIITEKVKGLLGYNGNNILIATLDLAYHTVLQFHFGTFRNIRGYLDTLIIGESRVGKSSTADTLRKTYGLGVFTSLAGNSATVPGLIGGSNKTTNGYQTRAGIIPQNHRGLIIFEEFGKSNSNIIGELTDIRSSNEVRITRVSGTISLPAMVRMIALTNPKTVNGMIKPIAAYPNGISVLTELVETAEDIARYDIICILPDRGNNQIDPLWTPEEPFAPEVYQTRVRWVWSRTPEQVIISDEIKLYIMQQSNAINQVYDSYIKIFGTEAWKKITRLAIAVAGYVVSTDESYENIIVLKEHVDYAIAFLKTLYDNTTFKLREFVEHERRYSQIDDEGVAVLQDLYTQHPMLILQLEQCSTASKQMLGAATGLLPEELNRALNKLIKCLFVKFQNYDIIPTERFRLGLARINRNSVPRGVGE